MRTVRILEEASQEAIEAAAWYEHEQAGLGAEFFAAVDTAIDVIEETVVIAIAHHSRKPGYWLGLGTP